MGKTAYHQSFSVPSLIITTYTPFVTCSLHQQVTLNGGSTSVAIDENSTNITLHVNAGFLAAHSNIIDVQCLTAAVIHDFSRGLARGVDVALVGIGHLHAAHPYLVGVGLCGNDERSRNKELQRSKDFLHGVMLFS